MNKNFVAAYRFGFGLLALAAIGVQLQQTVTDGRSVANFFSFFTIQSNLFAAFVLVLGALMLLREKSDAKIALVRGAAALYMTMTGVIFALLLSGLEGSLQVTIPWVNTVLHYVMPFVLFVDWLVSTPGRRINFKLALVWIVYPLAYLVYSLVRGAGTGWYPYPFLNVAAHGYLRVGLTSAVIAVGVIGLVALLALPTKRVRR